MATLQLTPSKAPHGDAVPDQAPPTNGAAVVAHSADTAASTAHKVAATARVEGDNHPPGADFQASQTTSNAPSTATSTPTLKKRRRPRNTPTLAALTRRINRAGDPPLVLRKLLGKPEGADMWCTCREGENERFMVGCDLCGEWYHGDCVGMDQKEAKKYKAYFCMACQVLNPHLAKRMAGGHEAVNAAAMLPPAAPAAPLAIVTEKADPADSPTTLATSVSALAKKRRSADGGKAAGPKPVKRMKAESSPQITEGQSAASALSTSAPSAPSAPTSAPVPPVTPISGSSAAVAPGSATSATTATPAAGPTLHPIRANLIKSLTTTLTAIFQQVAADPTSVGLDVATPVDAMLSNEAPNEVAPVTAHDHATVAAAAKSTICVDLTQPEAYAQRMEAALFATFHGTGMTGATTTTPSASPASTYYGTVAPGSAYKARARMLQFNLRDASNQRLKRLVVTGELNPASLATVPPEALGADAVAEAVAAVRQRSIIDAHVTAEDDPVLEATHRPPGSVDVDVAVGEVLESTVQTIPLAQPEMASTHGAHASSPMVVDTDNDSAAASAATAADGAVAKDNQDDDEDAEVVASFSPTTSPPPESLRSALPCSPTKKPGAAPDATDTSPPATEGEIYSPHTPPYPPPSPVPDFDDFVLEKQGQGVEMETDATDADAMPTPVTDRPTGSRSDSVWQGRLTMPFVASFDIDVVPCAGAPLSASEWLAILTPSALTIDPHYNEQGHGCRAASAAASAASSASAAACGSATGSVWHAISRCPGERV
ncbi:hypothetical protein CAUPRSCDRAFT_10537 [Caulochytrium protostelioides]|uniref:Transcription factor BYE1 n=1 Tax=Caulochytrium protostelioides TaxID=1555241 RepID=A0A4V1ITP9_9FUNG|nr:hypothetical protein CAUPRSCDRAFT_10537 [Caulochytrium protostelioides]